MTLRHWTSATLFATFFLGLAQLIHAEELVIAFTIDTPPYVMEHGKEGIELEIVREALAPKGYTFTVKQMPYGELPQAIADKSIDAVATVVKGEGEGFYSENYITFHNAAITKKSSGVKIDDIADLRGKSIVAWEHAYQDLGPKYEALFSPNVKAPYLRKYREIANQRKQVEMFWKGEAEVIVIDIAVFRWFTQGLAGEVDTSAPLAMHKIFPGDTNFRICFKSEKVRDDFDAGLNLLRSSGRYQKICDKFLQ